MLSQRSILPLLFACIICSLYATAQKPNAPKKKDVVPPVRPFYYKDHDSSYYQSFERYITARFYLSQKYAELTMQKSSTPSRLRYVPNTSLTMGVGITYQSISVNLGYGFGFLNNDADRGKTKSFDIQAHIYGRKWIYDLLGTFYKGFYLTPRGFAAAHPDNFYIRPDLRSQLLGVSAYRLLNPSRFSYRAALLENEKQKKSAGSFLIGAEMYYGTLKADSAFVPGSLINDFGQGGVNRFSFIKIGPGAGYVYTFVIKNDFYLTGSLCVSLNFDFISQYTDNEKATRFQVNKGFIYRVAAGYDKNNWNANISLVGNQMTVSGASGANKYLLSAGNFRFTIARRIKPGRALTKKLHPVDKVIENVKGLEPPKQ